MHGGVITAIMDETMGRAIMTRYGDDIWGVTAELRVRFRQPVPLDVELTAIGRIVEEKRRVFEGTGELYLPDGSVAVEASGTFVKMELGRIATFDRDREEWRVRPD